MFSNAQRPFYRSTQYLKLDKISALKYNEFIIRNFNSHKKSISEQFANLIIEWTGRHTYYTQVLCNRIFSLTVKSVNEALLKNAMWKLLKEQETFFFRYRSLLTAHQWNTLNNPTLHPTYLPSAYFQNQSIIPQHHICR